MEVRFGLVVCLVVCLTCLDSSEAAVPSSVSCYAALAKGGKTLGEGKVTAKPVAKKVVEAELPSKLAWSNGLKPLSPDLPDYSKLAKGDVKAEQARVTAQYEALKSKVKELQAATNASSTEVDTAKQNAAKLKDGVAENARQLKLNQEQAKLCVSMAEVVVPQCLIHGVELDFSDRRLAKGGFAGTRSLTTAKRNNIACVAVHCEITNAPE